MGQIGRTSEARYKEHILAIKTNEIHSKYAQPILDDEQSYGSMENTSTVLCLATKGKRMNTN
jgi:hypothetical protein